MKMMELELPKSFTSNKNQLLPYTKFYFFVCLVAIRAKNAAKGWNVATGVCLGG